jgi:uncharacterized protein
MDCLCGDAVAVSRRQLRISPRLSLPLEAVTETFALLAKRGAGKTYTASVLVEEMLAAHLQVVVVDPIGAWWGLRAGADGKPDGGYPVAVLGGDRGDVPLEPTGGALVADLVVDERLSAVLDLVRFSKGERRRFAADFLERLYQRNRDPLHVVLEEADLFAPEGRLKRAGDEAMLGAVYDLVRRGRGRGLGSTLITQRSASISKEVLTQTEILIALRTTGPHDRAAIEEWIRYHGSKDERDHVLGELSHLPTGTAFVWWPAEEILRKVEIRERRTYDSSATPKPGERRRAPKTLADVDLEQLRDRMAATIEKAKAEDPRELRRELAQVRKQLASRPKETERVEVPVEVPVIRQEDVEQLERILAPAVNGMSAVLKDAQVLLEELRDRAGKVPALSGREPSGESLSARAGKAKPPRVARPESAEQKSPIPAADGDFDPSNSQRRILDALAALEVIGASPADRTQLALFSKASPKSSGYTNNLGALRTAGLIDYPARGAVALTDAGRALADASAVPSNVADYQGFVRALVGRSKAKLVDVLIDVYPEALSREELAERAGASPNSSGYTNNLGSLRSLRLIDYPSPGYVVGLPVLFLEVPA